MNDIAKMDAPVNPFSNDASKVARSNASADSDQQRAIAEVQAAMMIARMNPRDPIAAMDRILTACQRVTLAEAAVYSYARGGTEVNGPSIRLAEAMAQSWGNMQFGIRELEQRNGESTVQAFAWDVETNTRREMTFQVKHERHTKRGVVRLKDPRDIYELTANQGARRLRSCILSVIPGDVTEEAVKQCELTVRAKVEITDDRLQKMLDGFAGYGVTRQDIEARIQRRLDTIQPAQFLSLGKIFNSLRDGMSKPADWFDIGDEPRGGAAEVINDQIKAGKNENRASGKDSTADEPPVTYPQVRQMIERATDADTLDVAADMIASVHPADQKQELADLLAKRRESFG